MDYEDESEKDWREDAQRHHEDTTITLESDDDGWRPVSPIAGSMPPASPYQPFMGDSPDPPSPMLLDENEDDNDDSVATSDLIARSRLSPDAMMRLMDHRKLVKRLSQRANGPGPKWRLDGPEQIFLNSLASLRRPPDCVFGISGAINLSSLDCETDTHVELHLDKDVAKLVVGRTEFVEDGEYLVFAYSSRKVALTTEIWLA